MVQSSHGQTESFITCQTQIVVVNEDESSVTSVLYGVPQGSILVPVLFLLCTTGVLAIIWLHRWTLWSFVSLWHYHLILLWCIPLSHPANCHYDMYWQSTSSNRLKLNTDKTRFIWLGTTQQLAKVSITLITIHGTDICVSDKVTCFSVLIDSKRTLGDYPTSLTGMCFYQLGQLRIKRRTLSSDAAKALIHALRSQALLTTVTAFFTVYTQLFHVHFSLCSTRQLGSSQESNSWPYHLHFVSRSPLVIITTMYWV